MPKFREHLQVLFWQLPQVTLFIQAKFVDIVQKTDVINKLVKFDDAIASISAEGNNHSAALRSMNAQRLAQILAARKMTPEQVVKSACLMKKHEHMDKLQVQLDEVKDALGLI